ncbi:pleckstrin homology domain-containing family G member 5-like isoform X2 [Watersipora subatra]|uniref:pleckstrin homology domain-containing family G member 5-like isoform X2 n=1 Tax=Watersipora subatra TaxID=2589382 RepID=UPI00355B6840
MFASSQTVNENRHGVQVIEIQITVDSETSVHKIFTRDRGHTLRDTVEPICRLKNIDLDSLGIYLDDDRSAALPLDYDIHSLSGHVLHVMEYKAPTLSADQVDGKLLFSKKVDNNSNLTSLNPQRKLATASRASSFAGKNREAVAFQTTKSKTPVIGRKSAPLRDKLHPPEEMYPQRISSGSGPLPRDASATSIITQPGGRRSRQSDIVAPMNMTSRLLGLSEGHSKVNEDSNANERRSKGASQSMEGPTSGEISPGGTLHKSKSASAKLSLFSSMQPQNSKDKEKMDILLDLLEQWEKTGPPGLPPLVDFGLPKFDSVKFELENHWTEFVDKTGLTQKRKDQQEALWELLYTEAEYIKALYVIHDLFTCCLLNIQSAGVLNDIVIEHMFSNIHTLALTNLHFWSELIVVLEHSRKRKCLLNPSLLKPAFTNFEDKFKHYTKYCVEQKACSEYVKKTSHDMSLFKYFVAWAEQQKQCNRLNLHDLLVKPMQRLTRYGLLLRAIHKNTDEEDVRQDLMEMINNVNKFVTDVDQTLTRADEKEKLKLTAARIEPYEAIEAPLIDSECSKILSQTYMNLDLLSPMPWCGQQLRYNLMEGALRLRDMNNKLDVHCILFTDMLLFTKPSKRDKLRIIKPPIRIDSLSIHEMKENPHLLLVHLTDFGVAQAAYTLHGDNISKWAKTFKKAQALYGKAKDQARKDSEIISMTDLDLDEIGFSGPLMNGDNGDTIPDLTENVFSPDPAPFESPQVTRVSSFNSLADCEGHEDKASPEKETLPHSVSSPDIGRKHHTLPSSYKHPPRGSVERMSSSSSGETAVVNNGRRPAAERKRRVGRSHRYKTADGAMGSEAISQGQTIPSQLTNGQAVLDQRISDKVACSASDDELDMSSTLNCDMVNHGANAIGTSVQMQQLSGYNQPLGTIGAEQHRTSSSSKLTSEERSKSKKLTQQDMIRLKNFQDFLKDSSPGVEI